MRLISGVGGDQQGSDKCQEKQCPEEDLMCLIPSFSLCEKDRQRERKGSCTCDYSINSLCIQKASKAVASHGLPTPTVAPKHHH